jgi:hypothetical protein
MKPKTNYLQKRSFLLMSAVTLMLLNSFNTSAQQDSTKMTYTEENKDSSDYLLRQKYSYININRKSENNLLKIGLQSSVYYDYRTSFQLGYEQKIKPSLSVFFKTAFEYYVYLDSSYYGNFHGIFGSFIIETRLYQGINKKIKKGLSGNNFNHNYFCLGVGGQVSSTSHFPNSQREIIMTGGWGMQRKLNNSVYADVSFRFNSAYRKDMFHLGLSIDMAIGLCKSFKKKR